MKANQPPTLPIRRLLQKYDLKPNKRLGQNFLVDDAALRKIVGTSNLSKDDIVLEIGPGMGSLTRHLAEEAYHVIVVELDRGFIKPLNEILAPYSNVTIIQGDILEQHIESLLATVDSESTRGFAVVANIPYYITSAVIRHLFDSQVKPDRIVLTVQKELAMRICAKPPNMSLLALSVQVFGKPKIMENVPAGAFYPMPKVDSAVIRIDIYHSPLVPDPYLGTFFRLARSGFGQKRKNLRNSLSVGIGISKSNVESILLAVNIDYRRRAETLNIDEWRELTFNFQDANLNEFS
jgi:16S rRNA (adenine1518-N6/adenine1519-N6)-dimethyltransferase